MLATYFASCEGRFCELKYAEKLSYAETATKMGLPVELVVILEQSMLQDLRVKVPRKDSPKVELAEITDDFALTPKILRKIAIYMLVQASKDLAEPLATNRRKRSGKINWNDEYNAETARGWLNQTNPQVIFSIANCQRLLDHNCLNDIDKPVQLSPIAELILKDPEIVWPNLKKDTQFGLENGMDLDKYVSEEYEFERSKHLLPSVSRITSALYNARFPENKPTRSFEEIWEQVCNASLKVARSRGIPDLFAKEFSIWTNGSFYDLIKANDGKVPNFEPYRLQTNKNKATIKGNPTSGKKLRK